MDSKNTNEPRHALIMKMLKDIAQREGVTNPNIEIVKGCEKGDGYLGEKSIAIIRGDNKSLELFIKAAPSDPAFKQALDIRSIYLQEILFYTKVMPTYNEFQNRKRIPKPFTSVIGCPGTCSEKDNELLILENVRHLGYELWDRKKQMNHEHVEFVYKEYGKLHGLSYALKDQEPEVYEGLVNGMAMDVYQFMEDILLQSCINIHGNIRTKLHSSADERILAAYSKFIGNLPAFLKKLVSEKHKFSVITHGDCWCTNMMFKYPRNSKKSCPEKVCLLDFQLMGQGPPVLDLSYFTYASASKNIYNNLDHYLKVYHDSLSKTVSDLGSPSSAMPTIEDLKDQWKVYGRYGLMISVYALKACVQDEDETQDISEVLKENDGVDMWAGFTKKSKNDDLYYERLENLIVHCVERGFI